MSSFYSDASLVMIPSGYKNAKVYSAVPTDGLGDLSFTRASNATRVASDGLIEKVRTNLLLQSNSFDTTWGNIGTSDTGGQSGYDGTNNAWLLDVIANIDSQRIVQSISASGSLTLSVYAKAGTKNWTRLFCAGTTTVNAYFDLQNGALGTATNCTSKIESAGNGYYRCSISFNTTITDARIYVATANNDIAQTSGNILIQAAQLETGDVMTDYIATTTAAVSVGPVSGLPRLDYLGSTCPRLLLEPQRTNLLQYSEQFNNAAWSTTLTVTPNDTTSPTGWSSADKISGVGNINQSISVTNGLSYNVSIFAKAGSGNILDLRFFPNVVDTVGRVLFDLSNGTFTVVSGATNAKMENYSNGWFRCSYTVLANATGTSTFRIQNSSNEFYIWGAQLEAGTYATSYIPTLGASVTRVADAASKTGISSLIGQTEGTLFAEVNLTTLQGAVARTFIDIGSSSNRVFVGFTSLASNTIRLQIDNTGGIRVDFRAVVSSTGTIKVAAAYKDGDCALYVNGVAGTLVTNNSISFATISNLFLGQTLSSTAILNDGINQALLFKTRLANSQLQELTTL